MWYRRLRDGEMSNSKESLFLAMFVVYMICSQPFQGHRDRVGLHALYLTQGAYQPGLLGVEFFLFLFYLDRP